MPFPPLLPGCFTLALAAACNEDGKTFQGTFPVGYLRPLIAGDGDEPGGEVLGAHS